MKGLREYVIPFIGLKNGLHHFNFEIGAPFFSHFPDSLIRECGLFVDLAFDKKERLFVLNFDISGTISTECDRCGQALDLPIHGNHTLYVKKGEQPEEEDEEEDITWIADGESELDTSDWIYEFIHLSIPVRKLHPDLADGTPGCNPDILARLGHNEDQPKDSDPRWDQLRTIIKDK